MSRADKLLRALGFVVLVGMAAFAGLAILARTDAVASTDLHKVFVCKYVGKPHVDERLQTGQNPIDVDIHSIPGFPADINNAVGFEFADAQGRSIVIAIDHGQPEPPVTDCPPPEGPPSAPPSKPPSNPPSKPPSSPPSSPPSAPPSSPPSAPPSAPPSTPPSSPPSNPPSSPPSSPPSAPPVATEFEVTTCPLASASTGISLAAFHLTAVTAAVPAGLSEIRFRGLGLLIAVLNVRVDGQLVTLQNTLGDGTVGDIIVAPGDHTWSISNQADTEVLASGTIICPVCHAAPATPATHPPHTAPPSDIATDLTGSGGTPVLVTFFVVLIALAIGVGVSINRFRDDDWKWPSR